MTNGYRATDMGIERDMVNRPAEVAVAPVSRLRELMG